MNDLPGNDYAYSAIAHRNESFGPNQSLERQAQAARIAQVNATLALAYEQHTTTMAILASINPEWYGSTCPETFAEIDARMGKAPLPPVNHFD